MCRFRSEHVAVARTSQDDIQLETQRTTRGRLSDSALPAAGATHAHNKETPGRKTGAESTGAQALQSAASGVGAVAIPSKEDKLQMVDGVLMGMSRICG